MAQIDREIERLYQLPLSEFTAARKKLATEFPNHKAAINKLPKPNLAAWAVNQLYWRERKIYDALTNASERVRAAQTRALKGGDADVAAAERLHASAIKAASETVREILGRAGDTASPSTMTAVRETLQALPAQDPPGRLTRPLKPLGFAALSGLLAGKMPSARQAKVIAFKPQTNAKVAKAEKAAKARAAADQQRAADAAKRQAAEQKKEVAALERALRQAQAAEERSTARVLQAKNARDAAEEALQTSKREAADATAKRREIEQKLRVLRTNDSAAADNR